MKTFIKFVALLIALMAAFLIVLLLCRGCYNKADRVRDNLATKAAIEVSGSVFTTEWRCKPPFYLTAR